jgi:hypothetical protein
MELMCAPGPTAITSKRWGERWMLCYLLLFPGIQDYFNAAIASLREDIIALNALAQ